MQECILPKVPKKMLGISILRIIATLAVFAVHFGQRMGLSGILHTISNAGQYGVQLFFIISGFLLVKSLDRCHDRHDFYQYCIKKGVRLLTLYYLIVLWYFLTETFIFHSIVPDPYHLGWLRYIFLLNGIVPANCYLWSNVGITWTIPIFAMAYLITPLWYKLIKTKYTETLSCAFLVSILLYFFTDTILNGWLSFFNYYYSFIGGMLICKAIQEKKIALAQAGTASLLFALLILDSMFVVSLTLIFMLIVSFVYDFTLPQGKLAILINELDKYSYTMYLGHGIIFCSILDKFAIVWPLRACIAVFGSIALTWILYNCYEKHVTKFLQKKFLEKK